MKLAQITVSNRNREKRRGREIYSQRFEKKNGRWVTVAKKEETEEGGGKQASARN